MQIKLENNIIRIQCLEPSISYEFTTTLDCCISISVQCTLCCLELLLRQSIHSDWNLTAAIYLQFSICISKHMLCGCISVVLSLRRLRQIPKLRGPKEPQRNEIFTNIWKKKWINMSVLESNEWFSYERSDILIKWKA